MRYCYWCNKCPYTQHCSQINYPASAYPDGYVIPLPEYYSDDFNLDNKKAAGVEAPKPAEKAEYQTINTDRTQQNITMVIEKINQRASQEIDEMLRTGIDRKLLDYLMRIMVQYIDKNYERYTDSVRRKVEMAIFDMKRDLGWVFDIMRIYNISSATENRLLDKLSRAAVQDLRPESSVQIQL